MAACSKLGLGGQDQMSWARVALERNDRIEVVAADSDTNTFTVRFKDSGELHMVRADQVIAAPPGLWSSTAAPGTAAPAAGEAASLGSAYRGSTSSDASPGAAALSTAKSTNGSSPKPGESATTAGARASGSNTQMANASDTNETEATRAGEHTGPQPQTAAPSEAPNSHADVASVTPGGRVLKEGPGYAIKTASKSTLAARPERERSYTTNSSVERRHDPIICQGARLLQIDNRNLEFDGDAVSAEDGCEIHITNSHITAKGVGVSARAANVHIDNSQIEGDSASIDASDGAQVYASSSSFKGVSRRLDNASFHDLGGNVWN